MGKANKQVTILRRHKTIKEIRDDLKNNHQPYTIGIIQKKLEDKKIKVDQSTIYRDLLSINKQNNFLLDLASSNYSQYVEEMWNNLNFIEEEAYKLAKQDWTIKRTITRSTKSGKVVTTSEEANQFAPKNAFLNLAARVITAKDSLLKGDHVDIAHGLLKEKFNQFREENQAYHSELEYKNKKIVELHKIIDGFSNNTRR